MEARVYEVAGAKIFFVIFCYIYLLIHLSISINIIKLACWQVTSESVNEDSYSGKETEFTTLHLLLWLSERSECFENFFVNNLGHTTACCTYVPIFYRWLKRVKTTSEAVVIHDCLSLSMYSCTASSQESWSQRRVEHLLLRPTLFT